MNTAFDDQSSTFIIPSGAGFEVVFCPGARSTNILSTESEKMRQLAQSGHVSENQQSRLKMDKYRRQVLVGSGAAQTFRLERAILVVTMLIMAYAALL